MAYCVTQDLYDALSQRAVDKMAKDEATDTAEIIAARIEAAIDKAGERIDGYLRGRYTLPIENAPGILTDLCVDIALYFIAGRKGIAEGTPEKNLETKYRDAIAYLKDVQAGRADIGLVDDEGNSAPTAKSDYRTPDQEFTDDFFGGF